LATGLLATGLVVLPAVQGLSGPPATAESILASSAPVDALKIQLSRFVEAPVGVKPGRINPKDLRLLAKLIEAADYLDSVFWMQVSEEALDIRQVLSQVGGEQAAVLVQLLGIHYGPWDRLENNRPFVGNREKPAGAAFYPADLSRLELQGYMDANPETIGDLLSPYTVVRRKGAGLVAIPFSEKYRELLTRAGGALREAAAFSDWPSLKDFLLARADALATDDYYHSEVKWMDTEDCPYIVVFGPYEFYEDRLMGSKAAFEAIIALRDDGETQRFKGLAEQIPAILEGLPVDAELKAKLVAIPARPITVADEIYAAGDTRAGAQTTAFSLPNDTRVREKKGTRQVILRNVARAKFNHSWLPLSRLVVAEEQSVDISFDSYFDQLITVELARSILPGTVTAADKSPTSAREGLRQRYHALEEAKSDVLGLYMTFELMDKGMLEKRRGMSIAATYLASVFRVIRFDVGGTHGLAKAMVFNSLARRGAFVYDPTTRRYGADMKVFRTAVQELLKELLEVMVAGDYDRAGRLIVEYGLVSEDMREKLSELGDVPVDIRPEYPIKKALEKGERNGK
jgi:hypothetical protein